MWIRRRSSVVLAFVAAVGLSAATCSRPNNNPKVQDDPAGPGGARQPVSSGAAANSNDFKIVFLGDSLTAGFGLLTQEAFPALIEAKFQADGYSKVEIVNAGVSGDTTAGARRRVDQALEPGTRILVVALGGNDALRGLSTTDTRDNLAAILESAKAKNVPVLLAGMQAPTNVGEDYREKFAAIYNDLAVKYSALVTFVPFLLEGVGGNASLNQPDGIHPNPAGAKVIADLLFPKLRTMVDAIGGGG